MKKENSYKFLYAVSIFLIVGFAITLKIDYSKYNTHSSSAPFCAFIIERTVEFILPSIIVFVEGKVVKRKYTRNTLKS